MSSTPSPLPIQILGLENPKGYSADQQQIPEEMYLNIIELLRKFPHAIAVGNTGSGKGTYLSRQVENAIEDGMKVLSFHNSGLEIETAFKYWPAEGRYRKLLEKRGGIPKGYKVVVYMPVCKGYTPKKLPPDSENLQFKLYTVPIAGFPTMNSELFGMVNQIGITEIGKEAIDNVLERFSADDNLANFYYHLNRAIEEGLDDLKLWFKVASRQSRETMERIIFTLLKYRMVSSANFELAMTDKLFREILNRQEEISVFCQAYVPRRLQAFFTMLPLQYAFMNSEFCNYPLLMVANEVQRILANPEKRHINPAKEMFSNTLAETVLGARKFNIHFLLDTQILTNIHPDVVSQSLILGFYTKMRDRKELEAFSWNAAYLDKLRDLEDELLFLKHDPQKGIFEYYVPEFNRTYLVELPSTTHPWEGVKGKKSGSGSQANFLKFVRERGGGAEDWEDTTWVYEVLEAEIKKTVEETPAIQQYIANRKKREGLQKMMAEDMGGIADGEKSGKIEPTPRMKKILREILKLKNKGLLHKEIEKKLGFKKGYVSTTLYTYNTSNI